MTPAVTLVWIAMASFGCSADAQVDPKWLRMWRQAQIEKPERLDSSGRIAPRGEPGIPLVVHGRVLAPDGRNAVEGAVVFAYQTDRSGIYAPPGEIWRLRGWAVTDAEGRFTFRTIRPGPYPGGGTPAHIHFTVETEEFGRQWTPELRFADDPYLTAEERQESAAQGAFGGVLEVRTARGTQHVDYQIRLKPDADF